MVPTRNTAIDSVTESDGTISITFADPFPDDVHQGVWALDYTIREIEHSENRTVTWRIDGEERSVDFVVRAPGDQFENGGGNPASGKTLATTGASVGLAVLAALALLGSGLMFRIWSSRRRTTELDG